VCVCACVCVYVSRSDRCETNGFQYNQCFLCLSSVLMAKDNYLNQWFAMCRDNDMGERKYHKATVQS